MRLLLKVVLPIIAIVLIVGYFWGYIGSVKGEVDGSELKNAQNTMTTKGLQVVQTIEGVGQGPLDGKQAPDFKLSLLNGGVRSVTSFKGSPVVLISWATWCTQCEKEFANLEARVKKTPFPYQVVLVNMTSEEASQKVVENYVRVHRISFPVLMDPKGAFQRAYRVQVVPTSYLIDAYGNVLHTFYGPIKQSTIQEWIPMS